MLLAVTAAGRVLAATSDGTMACQPGAVRADPAPSRKVNSSSILGLMSRSAINAASTNAADYSAPVPRCYHSRMLDQLDALTSRMQELVAHVRQLRDENHQLRTQLATSQTELAALNERIVTATRRLDALIERLPGDAARGATDADAG